MLNMSVTGNLDQELDSHDARTDFENLLQEILNQANAEERFVEENAKDEDEKDSSSEEMEKGQKTTMDSPHKLSTPKPYKKRRKRHESKEDKHKPNAFIMKLFDRSVDLAAFNDETPLYPICRAWMENDPSGKLKTEKINGLNPSKPKTDDESASNSEDEEVSGSIAKIPPPNIPWNNFNAEGKYVSPRIPKLLPQPRDKLDKYVMRESVEPQPETLLINHLRHWKKVRSTWKEKSLENDTRYKDGMDLLQDIFQRNLFNSSAGQ